MAGLGETNKAFPSPALDRLLTVVVICALSADQRRNVGEFPCDFRRKGAVIDRQAVNLHDFGDVLHIGSIE